MYKRTTEERSQVYCTVMPNVERLEASRISPCPTYPLINYTTRTCQLGDDYFKEKFERVLEKETVQLLLAYCIHDARYRVRYSRQGVPRITKSQGYGLLTPLTASTMTCVTMAYITELFFWEYPPYRVGPSGGRAAL